MKEEILKTSKKIFTGKILTLKIDEVILPNGKIATREIINHPGATCILAITKDKKIILVKQFRYACNDFLLEIPAGKIEKNENNPKDCAIRELAEETPYTTKSIELIYEYFTAPGFCDEKMYFYLAKNVEQNSNLKPDEDEFVQTVLLTKEETKKALSENKIKDAKTLIAVLYWLSI